MVKRERVLRDIGRCTCYVPDACVDCSKYGTGNVVKCMRESLKDSMELLIEHETGVRWIKISPAGIYECSGCGQNVMTSDIDAYKYCHGCGKKVKWE